MALSSDLISQFVKITNDNTKSDKETIVYGTTVEYDGKMYVRIDGSELLTPVETTAGMGADERVTIMIKNHSAVVTGNISSPSARSSEVITVDKLNAQAARIDSLVANNVTVNETLKAHTADIEYLEANMITSDNIDAKFVRAEQLEATNAKIDTLTATHATFETATTERLNAAEAKIVDLDAIKADVKDLDADVADINTLIFGSATGNTIQTSFANAVIAQLGDAQIKSAMIDSVSASKITAGDIITNNVRIKSEDGSLIISDETMQISDDTRVRVQIGKDASNDYSINIWDADGELMFSQGGITDAAIKDAIIRNDMVSDTANISAHKLDIDSLFEEINKNGSNTIKSTKVYLDDEKQTLDVAFKGLTTDVNDLGETVSSQGTRISAVQGQISSKVWQQDINTAKNEMSTQYSTLEQEVDGFKTTVSETYATKTDVDGIEIGGRNYVANSSEEKHVTSYYTTYSMVDARTALQDKTVTVSFDAKRNADGKAVNIYAYFRNGTNGALTPSSNKLGDITTEYKRYVATIEAGALMSDATHIAININTTDTDVYIKNVKVESGNKATDWTAAPEDADVKVSSLEERVTTAETAIEQHTDAIALTATKTEVATAKSEAISSANANTANLLTDYSTTEEMNSAIQLKADSITSSVSSTYATKASVESINIGGKNLLKDSRHVLLYSNNDSTIPITRTLMTENGREFYRYTRTDIDSNPTLLSLYSGIPVTQLTEKIFGSEVTFSWLVRCSHETTADLMAWMRVDGTTTELPSDRSVVTVGTEWKRMSFTETINLDYELVSTNVFRANPRTFTIPDGEIENFYVDICEWKIEKGNKPTDWTVCPDDITLVESIDIGVRNLVLDSSAERSFTNSIAQWNLSDYGMENVKNKSVTISFDAYTDETGTAFDFYLRGVTSDNAVVTSDHTVQNGLTDSYVRYSATIDVGDVAYQTLAIRAGKNSIAANKSSTATYYIKNVKVETGHKPTDWTPAPEDLETRVTSAESSITQLSNKITSNVTETTKLGTRMTSVEQTASSLSIEVDDAAKTATNYLFFDSDGLMVGDMTNGTHPNMLGKNVLIDSDSVDIRNGYNVLASFGANEIILGQNDENSVIDLCDGAGKIQSVTSEANTGYPKYDAIKISSQEILHESQRNVTTTKNTTSATSGYENTGQIYMLSQNSDDGGYARIESFCKNTSLGDCTQAGCSTIARNSTTATNAYLYAQVWDESASAWVNTNALRVYPTKTTTSKPVYIDGTAFTGSNKVLWSGTYYMSDTQTATLSEAISAQANGIVLVWSYYTNGAADNSNFQMTYIPKHFITLHAGKGVVSTLTNSSTNMMCSKYTYVSDTKITGYAGNDDASAVKDTGITTIPKNFVLRYVIGV